MAKTRSEIAIKKEEQDVKNIQPVPSASNAVKSKITKRKIPKRKSSLPSAISVKVEQDIDTKPLLEASPTFSTLGRPRDISRQQIAQLIHYVAKDGPAQSFLQSTNRNDPDKMIPLPQHLSEGRARTHTQEEISKLIKYIVDDGMSVLAASAKLNLGYRTALAYCRKYLEDPNHNIPTIASPKCKQEQIAKLIGHIVNDKMTIKAASKKVNVSPPTGSKYYHIYLDDPQHKIPFPSSLFGQSSSCTQYQIERQIRYIVNDNMSAQVASKKACMSLRAGSKYYQRYLKDPNQRIPAPATNGRRSALRRDPNRIKQLISYLVDDKMTLQAASAKANMNISTDYKHYRRCINNQKRQRVTREQITRLIRYIVVKKMSMSAASKKADMAISTGYKHYKRYLEDL